VRWRIGPLLWWLCALRRWFRTRGRLILACRWLMTGLGSLNSITTLGRCGSLDSLSLFGRLSASLRASVRTGGSLDSFWYRRSFRGRLNGRGPYGNPRSSFVANRFVRFWSCRALLLGISAVWPRGWALTWIHILRNATLHFSTSIAGLVHGSVRARDRTCGTRFGCAQGVVVRGNEGPWLASVQYSSATKFVVQRNSRSAFSSSGRSLGQFHGRHYASRPRDGYSLSSVARADAAQARMRRSNRNITTHGFGTDYLPRQCFISWFESGGIRSEVSGRNCRHRSQVRGINASQICQFISAKRRQTIPRSVRSVITRARISTVIGEGVPRNMISKRDVECD
jgi:hypothetical protein